MLVIGWQEKSQMKPSDRDWRGHYTMQESTAFRTYLSHTRRSTGKDGIAWLSRRYTVQRGRPPKTRKDNITEWIELTLCEAVRLSQDRATWSRIVFSPNDS